MRLAGDWIRVRPMTPTFQVVLGHSQAIAGSMIHAYVFAD